jgi:hypothetical protein
LFGKQYKMSSGFAMDVSIVIVDVTPTADMAAFSPESMMPLQVTVTADGDWLAHGPTVSSGDNASKLTSFDVMVHY